MLFLAVAILSLCGAVSAYCGTASPSEHGLSVHREFARQKDTDFEKRQTAVQIEVYVHVILNSTEDDPLHEETLQQMDMLNQVFTETGFSFTFAGLDTPVVENQGAIWVGTEGDATIKQYRIEGAQVLNLYIVHEIADGYAGYAPKRGGRDMLTSWLGCVRVSEFRTFPWEYTANPELDGVVVQRPNVPGGSDIGLNTGKTAAHEAGHWLGLLHTFAGGCDGEGDLVTDTPAEAFEAEGCPVGRDTCPGGGVDPIHNYMDYTNDACQTEFTSGQIARMAQIWEQFRGG